MYLTINKINQIIFFLIIFIGSIFNGSNSNNLVIINFFILLGYFIYLLRSKNNLSKVKFIIKKNKNILIIFFIFCIYLIFQLIPLPITLLSFFSNNYYDFLNKLGLEGMHSISLNPRNSFFELVNYLNIFIIILLTHLIFFKKSHINRYFFYLCLVGFIHAFFAVLLFLLGNPEFFLEKIIYYKNSSTGFFINRTNLSFFLILSFIAGLHLLFNQNFLKNNLNKHSNINFDIIYCRIFLLFISIAIITSFSRLGNFYLLIILLIYFVFSLIKTKKIISQFSIIFSIIVIFDLFIIGFYFGGSKLIDRFLFINEDLNINNSFNLLKDLNSTIIESYSRLDIILISKDLFYKFFLFGFGTGSYENAFLLFYEKNFNFYANHAHSDFLELIGEVGIFGFLIFLILFYKIFKLYIYSKPDNVYNLNLILFILIFIFLINGLTDFSLNIPSNQYLFASLFTITLKKYY